MFIVKIIWSSRLISKCHFCGHDMVRWHELHRFYWQVHCVSERHETQLHMRKICCDPDFFGRCSSSAENRSPSVPLGQNRHGWLTDEINWAGLWVPTVSHKKELTIRWFTQDSGCCLMWDMEAIQQCTSSLYNDGRGNKYMGEAL